ncbi:hypothetical protein ISM_11970 [Roseovarius nubinhibens ISM]|uniref:Uncharacterized protein n=1 Tax=Roseovarius nubinhibens (strain ATCC BAA-591 / DSM 15170 / ISM) TaxID=89187 RepID=A3SM99_ROSNI|nr:hypothetical protein ISM_11970 [Roseovarius nubinhibens ISM]
MGGCGRGRSGGAKFFQSFCDGSPEPLRVRCDIGQKTVSETANKMAREIGPKDLERPKDDT